MNQFIFKSGFCDLCLSRQVCITILQYIPPLNIKNMRNSTQTTYYPTCSLRTMGATVLFSNQVLQCQSSTAVRPILSNNSESQMNLPVNLPVSVWYFYYFCVILSRPPPVCWVLCRSWWGWVGKGHWARTVWSGALGRRNGWRHGWCDRGI